MSTHNIYFNGEIEKYLLDTHSNLDLCLELKSFPTFILTYGSVSQDKVVILRVTMA